MGNLSVLQYIENASKISWGARLFNSDNAYFIALKIYAQSWILIRGHMRDMGKKVIFRERGKSAYFRSARGDSDNKWLLLERLGGKLLLDTLTSFNPKTIWRYDLSLMSVWKIKNIYSI